MDLFMEERNKKSTKDMELFQILKRRRQAMGLVQLVRGEL